MVEKRKKARHLSGLPVRSPLDQRDGRRIIRRAGETMYPDYAFYEFYPAEIVDEVLETNPGIDRERLHELMQEKWDAIKRQSGIDGN
jgi:hypothetical protein